MEHFTKKYDEKIIILKENNVKKPLVSVIIPVFNTEKYLQECLNTVRSQLLRNIEIICINDGSTDDSLNIVLSNADRDQRITVINQKNCGAAISRNNGLKVAKGEYITFLDSDDYFENDFLSSMYEKCKKYKSDVGVCDCYWNEKYCSANIKNIPINFTPMMFQFNIFSLFFEVPWNKVYRRKFIINNGFEFQNLPNSNDVYFASIVLIYANNITYINKPFIHYRYGIDGQISKKRHKNPFAAFKALKKIYSKIYDDISKFSMYRIAFNRFAINSLNNRYKNAEDSIKEKFRNYILDIGLKQIGMFEKYDYVLNKHGYELLKFPNVDERTDIESKIKDYSDKLKKIQLANKNLNNKIDVLKKTIKILSN